jgi:hypothetical protein
MLLLSACAGERGSGALLPASPAAPLPLGVYEIEMAGIGSAQPHSSIRPARAASGMRGDLAPVAGGLVFEQASSSSFTDGARGAGGQRYVSFTYRVRNGSGGALNNLTLLMVTRAGSIAGSPLSQLKRFDGSPASSAIAPLVIPTGAVAMGSDLASM